MDLDALAAAAALRMNLALEPIDGPGGRVMPPTHPEARKVGNASATGHVVETYHEDGRSLRRVLVDSIASQANRHEAALVTARRSGRVGFPDLKVDLTGTAAPMPELLVSELPHRLADAIVRDSEVGNTSFGHSGLGHAILTARMDDLSPILEASPTTLLFGAWFSQWKRPDPLRLQRLVTAEIWARDAVLGRRVGSRIDPLGITRLDLFETEGGDWTADEAKAKRDRKGSPVRYTIGREAARPSNLNHGNVAPTVEDELGITAASYDLRWALSLAALRRLSFGGEGTTREARRETAHRYLVALALAARALADEAGYALRSRCDLLRAGPHEVEAVRVGLDGLAAEAHALVVDDALAALKRAAAEARDVGFHLDESLGEDRTLRPKEALRELINKSKEVKTALDAEDVDA